MPSDDKTEVSGESDPLSDPRSSLDSSKDAKNDRRPTPSSPSFFEYSVDETSPVEFLPIESLNISRLPQRFADYTVVEKLGEGGAGLVFRAEPDEDHEPAFGHPQVALKVIRPEIVTSRKALMRFEKESRLLSEIDSPYVTRHLEFGVHRGIYFIASEFVKGFSLDSIVDQVERLPAEQTLRIIADLLEALSAMHSKGVIHRDVKPANVIAKFEQSNEPALEPDDLGKFIIAKLTDFGLARHIDQSQSLAMTRQYATLGTPTYMAPEQRSGSDTVDARADVYSAGVTLYHLLAGNPPFLCDDQVEMAEMHRTERPMPLTFQRQDIGEAVNSIAMKALEKDPSLRYQDADEMLSDVQQVLNGRPAAIRLYPETPDASDVGVKHYDFKWTLDATPKALWPLVSDTDRFNRAIGLPAPEFRYDHSGKRLKIFAKANYNGMTLQWREHPFQWICEREMSVLREFESGPFAWVTSTVELHPLANQKTRLLHRFQVKPRGLLGKMLTPFQFAFMTRRSLNKVYARLEQMANDQSCSFGCDLPYHSPPKLNPKQWSRLTKRVDALGRALEDNHLAQRFGDFIMQVADPIAARIRPLTLPTKLNCSDQRSLQVCWSSIEAGLLNLSWDIICPVCKIASDNVSSFDQIESHAHCKVCDIEFETDLTQAVEMIFSVHPDIRTIELKTYCIGGPYHAPHVLGQNRLLPGQHVDLGVDLDEGAYEISGPQLNKNGELDVTHDAPDNRAHFIIGVDSNPPLPPVKDGPACVQIDNQSDVELLVRLSRKVLRKDAMTAGMAQQNRLFKKLFPENIYQADSLVEVANLHLLAIHHTEADSLLEQIGDVQLRHYWNQLQQKFPVQQQRCSIEECSDELLLVSFSQLDDLLDAFNKIVAESNETSGIPISECCFAIQSGEVMTASSANQATVFGKTVRRTKKWVASLAAKQLLIPREHDQSLREIITQFEKPEDSDSLTVDRDVVILTLRDSHPMSSET